MCFVQNLNYLALLLRISLYDTFYLIKNIITYYYLNKNLQTDFLIKN